MKSILIAFFLSFAYFAHAQKGTPTISFSYGDGRGQIKPIMAKAEMTGHHSEGSIKTYDIGLVGAISKCASIEIGVSLLNHHYQYTSYIPPGVAVIQKTDNSLVFPIKLRVDVLKYFFISGGVLLNEAIGKDGGLDLGFGIGAGVQYYVKNRYGLFIYPQTSVHSLAIGLSEKHIAFGLAYKIR